MASNNYAELIADPVNAQQVVAQLAEMAPRVCSFTVMAFDPTVDRFALSCWRESNFPTLLDVEANGCMVEGAAALALWRSNFETVKAVNFGNGYLGLYYESKDRSYLAIPHTVGSSPGAQGCVGMGTACLKESFCPHVCSMCRAGFGCTDNPCNLPYESTCGDCCP